MLNLYSIFHLNLMYSSIEVEDRHRVVEKCYWPLLELANKGFSIGLEATGITLELIAEIDSRWISELKSLIHNGYIEFVGSGYAQIIGPLVPATVNDWNQKLGLEVYREMLDIKPNIALVNEMAYSSGIVEHYINNGYGAIIMEWNNPRKYHPEWKNEWRFFPQMAVGSDKRTIPLIWSDSIVFQKFQRYAHSEYNMDEYMKYIESHISEKDRFFPLYANDAEIFDLRPGRYRTEALLNYGNEWNRINDLFFVLEGRNDIQLIKPSEVLNVLSYPGAGHAISLESPEQPIPVKKQEKYNINRWALTGRDDLGINTECFKIYDLLRRHDINNHDDWKELCYLWSSDFRTHITERRWNEFQKRLKAMGKRLAIPYVEIDIDNQKSNINLSFGGHDIHYGNSEKYLTIETNHLLLRLNKRKGLTIDKCIFKGLSDKQLLCTLEHGYYDDISLGADFFSGHSLIELPGKNKFTDLQIVEPEIIKHDNRLFIKSKIEVERAICKREIIVEEKANTTELQINKTIILPNRELGIIHPIHFTFYPEAWKKESLYFKTHNGGTIETFRLGTSKIEHSDILSTLISSKHGLGATNGIVIVGDEEKSLWFKHSLNHSALIPSFIYLLFENQPYFLRLQYSAQEVDETFVKNTLPQCISINISISGQKKCETEVKMEKMG